MCEKASEKLKMIYLEQDEIYKEEELREISLVK